VKPFLEQFFTDNWSQGSLWDECHDAARRGKDLASIRKELIDSDPAVQQAKALGIIDDAWLEDLFTQLAAIVPVPH
jgi:hypothetical protein